MATKQDAAGVLGELDELTPEDVRLLGGVEVEPPVMTTYGVALVLEGLERIQNDDDEYTSATRTDAETLYRIVQTAMTAENDVTRELVKEEAAKMIRTPEVAVGDR